MTVNPTDYGLNAQQKAELKNFKEATKLKEYNEGIEERNLASKTEIAKMYYDSITKYKSDLTLLQKAKTEHLKIYNTLKQNEAAHRVELKFVVMDLESNDRNIARVNLRLSDLEKQYNKSYKELQISKATVESLKADIIAMRSQISAIESMDQAAKAQYMLDALNDNDSGIKEYQASPQRDLISQEKFSLEQETKYMEKIKQAHIDSFAKFAADYVDALVAEPFSANDQNEQDCMGKQFHSSDSALE